MEVNIDKEQKEVPKKPEKPSEDEAYINKEEALERLLKATDLNITLVWMAATMATIAAINSLDGSTIFIKCLIFMIIGLISLLIYNRRYKKEK